MGRKRKLPPQLNVVFDTSALYTQVAYDLIRKEVKEIIQQHTQHTDLSIKWYLPEIVIHERQYQMNSEAIKLLPALKKLETLLGHSLNITEDILKQRVKEAVRYQIDEFGFKVLSIDTNNVDWNELILRAAYRKPPFEPGEKEKGFRDVLIGQAFLQLVEVTPTTPSICKNVIVTVDGLLRDYLEEKTKSLTNVRILASINELEGFINTLVSTVTEEFVKEISEKAEKYFFEKENQTTLYYREHIRDKILEKYSHELSAILSPDLVRENGTWWISAPIFKKKERQRVHWITHISVDATLSRYEYQVPSLGLLSGSPLSQPIPPRSSSLLSIAQRLAAPASTGLLPSKTSPSLAESLAVQPRKIEVNKGKTSFEVYWSVNITQNKRLTSPKIEKIQFGGTKWDME